MTAHTEDTLRRPSVSKVLDLAFAIAAAEAGCAEGLIAGEDSKLLDLAAASIAAICTAVADEGAIAEEEEVRIGIEQSSTGVTAEAVEMPSVASKFERFAFLKDISTAFARKDVLVVHGTVEIVVHDGGHVVC